MIYPFYQKKIKFNKCEKLACNFKYKKVVHMRTLKKALDH